MNLVWVTDPHLNFQNQWGGPYGFGQWLAKNDGKANGCIITGDIAEGHNIRRIMQRFIAGYGKPTYFVFGNHDYYESSWAAVHKDAEKWAKGHLHWLRKEGVIDLGEGVAICGNEGWYDGRAGHDPIKPRIIMHDWRAIKELRGKSDFDRKVLIADTARHWAKEAEMQLRAACEKFRYVVFATHVPPFPEATWHEGEVSNNDWLPWMCNVTLGDTLIEVAYDFPDTKILTLCGHTHSRGQVKMAPNLLVMTGQSDYRYPQISREFALPGELELLF